MCVQRAVRRWRFTAVGATSFPLFALTVLGLWLKPALAQKPLGVDVSYWQGASGISQANWNAIAAAGRSFAFVRIGHYSASGENHHGSPDPTCNTNVTRAQNAGLLVGVYYFARPTQRTPQVEANEFVTYATTTFGTNFLGPGYLRPVLDMEDGGGQVPVGAANLAIWCNDWITSVKNQTGVEPMIYSNTNYATNYLSGATPSLATRTLWLANWTCPADPQTGSPSGSNPDGIWSSYAFWQYCSSTGIPGVSLGNVDQNLFNGTAAGLLNYKIPNLAPMIVLSTNSLSRTVGPGLNLASETFTVANDTSVSRNTLNYTISDNASWLSVTPLSGASTNSANTHTINYTTSGLSVGQYTGTITVSDPTAINNPQQLVISLSVEVPGDFDTDGDVDLTDFGMLQRCLNGPQLGVPAGCSLADINDDAHVDQNDVAVFVKCISGAEIPAQGNCASS